jgi:hypothetical protein
MDSYRFAPRPVLDLIENDTRACQWCEFFEATEDDEEGGFCHRYAPIPSVAGVTPHAQWPYTLHSDWCGDFQRIP